MDSYTTEIEVTNAMLQANSMAGGNLSAIPDGTKLYVRDDCEQSASRSGKQGHGSRLPHTVIVGCLSEI